LYFSSMNLITRPEVMDRISSGTVSQWNHLAGVEYCPSGCVGSRPRIGAVAAA